MSLSEKVFETENLALTDWPSAHVAHRLHSINQLVTPDTSDFNLLRLSCLSYKLYRHSPGTETWVCNVNLNWVQPLRKKMWGTEMKMNKIASHT